MSNGYKHCICAIVTVLKITAIKKRLTYSECVVLVKTKQGHILIITVIQENLPSDINNKTVNFEQSAQLCITSHSC